MGHDCASELLRSRRFYKVPDDRRLGKELQSGGAKQSFVLVKVVLTVVMG